MAKWLAKGYKDLGQGCRSELGHVGGDRHQEMVYLMQPTSWLQFEKGLYRVDGREEGVSTMKGQVQGRGLGFLDNEGVGYSLWNSTGSLFCPCFARRHCPPVEECPWSNISVSDTA